MKFREATHEKISKKNIKQDIRIWSQTVGENFVLNIKMLLSFK